MCATVEITAEFFDFCAQLVCRLLFNPALEVHPYAYIASSLDHSETCVVENLDLIASSESFYKTGRSKKLETIRADLSRRDPLSDWLRSRIISND